MSDVTYIAKDSVTGDYYGGDVHPDVVAEVFASGEQALCVQRSVIADEYGTVKQVWVWAPELDLPGPPPGEYRWITVEEVAN